MYIEDLYRFPAGHPPSPYSFPVAVKKGDKWGYGQLEGNLELCAVGWLGDFVPSEGETPDECISALWEAYESNNVLSDGTSGFHNCELCHGDNAWYPGGKVGPIVKWRETELQVMGHGHFLIQTDELVYLAPVLILHYIINHKYRPPDEFIEAVNRGAILEPSDLIWVGDIDN